MQDQYKLEKQGLIELKVRKNDEYIKIENDYKDVIVNMEK